MQTPNYLYKHTLPNVEELKERTIDQRRRTTMSGPKKLIGARRKRAIAGFDDTQATRKVMREVKRADDLDKFHEGNSEVRGCDAMREERSEAMSLLSTQRRWCHLRHDF